MALNIFGFELKKSKEDQKEIQTVVTPQNTEGSLVIDHSIAAGGLYTYGVDFEGTVKNENELILRYRSIAEFPEVEFAINDITDESIVADQEENIIALNLDMLKVSESVKKKFNESFEEILHLLDFNKTGHDVFRKWYIDGRLFYHIMFGENTKQGIKELRIVDPLKIKKIKNIKRKKLPSGVEVIESIEEYYIYNDRGITESTINGIKLTLDSIVYVPSGLLDGT